jgi:hypothetical protein
MTNKFTGMITLAEFHNGLRILRSIDSYELGDPEWWPAFRDNPYLFFVCTRDEIQERIWTVMLKRGVQDA